MSTDKKHIIILLGLFLIFCIICFIVFSCGPKFFHDNQNPCDAEYYDSAVCEQWKLDFPGEYKRYLKRKL